MQIDSGQQLVAITADIRRVPQQGSEPTAAGGGVKEGERVAAVGR